MNSLTPRCSEDSFQDRINRMTAWKQQQKNNDEEFLRRQKIRLFINNCDEIRVPLRNQLLKDSKLCQYEQMKDQELRCKEMQDFEAAWNEILNRDYHKKTLTYQKEQERRIQEGKSVQNFLKQQMIDKIDRERIHEEINERKKIIAKESQEIAQEEIDRIRRDFKKRETLKDEKLRQIYESREKQRREYERERKIDQIFNEQIRLELEREEKARKDAHAHFKREIHHYLDYLRVTKHQHDIEEREKEKLIEDIRKKQCDDAWIKRCRFFKQREVVNEKVRDGQRLQMHEQEKLKELEARNERDFNFKFNEREMKERELLREEKWKNRLKSYHYGQELIEQKKLEELRRKDEKQKLEEELMLIEQEKLRCEEIGKEFVKSALDILPIHPNLRIIMKGKKY